MNKHKHYKAPWLRYVMSCVLSVLVVALMIAVTGCTQKEAPSELQIPSHFTTYTDEAGLFSISYPPDWEPALWAIEDLEQATKDLIESIESNLPLEKVSGIFFAGVPTETGYMPNVNIVVESLPGVVLTHDRVVEAEIRGIKEIVQDYHEFSRIKTTIGGREATILDWEGTIPGLPKQHSLQLIMLVGKVAWLVSCTPPTGEFNKWEEDFDAIVRSLRILK